MDGLNPRCAAHFHASSTRCQLDAGHEGNHLERGFAQWDEPLSHYPTITEELF